MPVGIAKLLDILGNSCIEVIEVEEEKDEAKAEETPEAEKPEGDKPREAEAVAKTELYNVVLDKKPNKSQLAKVVAAIVSGSGGIVTEENVMNSIQNSTNMTVLTAVKKEVADNVISAAEAVGGKLRKILIG